MLQIMVGGRAYRVEQLENKLKILTPKKKVIKVDTKPFIRQGKLDLGQVKHFVQKSL